MAEMRHVEIRPEKNPDKYNAWVAILACRLFFGDNPEIEVIADSEDEAKMHAHFLKEDVFKLYRAICEIVGVEAKF